MPLLNGFAIPLLAKVPEILKTINARFVPIAPTKVERIPADNIEIAYLEFVADPFRLQGPLSRPFIHALRARAHPSQCRSPIIAHSIVSPGNPQLRVALLRNLARLNRLASLCCVDHFVLGPLVRS